jgi:hypothetical protein
MGLGLVSVFAAAPALAQHNTARKPPTIDSGAIELGVDGSMTTTEGITRGMIRVRGGAFRAMLDGLGGLELETGYRHVSSLDGLDLEVVASWQKRFQQTGNYPFVSVGGGLRHEDIGSFSQTLYPLGFSVGVRSLLGQRGGFRVEYRFRRILNDPSSDFSEHRVLVGLSVFFRNPGTGSSQE